MPKVPKLSKMPKINVIYRLCPFFSHFCIPWPRPNVQSLCLSYSVTGNCDSKGIIRISRVRAGRIHTSDLPPDLLNCSNSVLHPSAFSLELFSYLSISKGELSAISLASANNVYFARVQGRCSGGAVPWSRFSINASRTR